ncbi:MAG: hypothetical protein H7338_08675 [Candidatus Sericytochromatia bacterium]|nr:hypothetical protein [Candidatus Sericytochromatia bacterium]
MTVGQMSKTGFLVLVLAATAACGRSPVMPLPLSAGIVVPAAGFELNTLSLADIATVTQVMAQQHPGFTVTTVTGQYLR